MAEWETLIDSVLKAKPPAARSGRPRGPALEKQGDKCYRVSEREVPARANVAFRRAMADFPKQTNPV